jgi:hypothetical protein
MLVGREASTGEITHSSLLPWSPGLAVAEDLNRKSGGETVRPFSFCHGYHSSSFAAHEETEREADGEGDDRHETAKEPAPSGSPALQLPETPRTAESTELIGSLNTGAAGRESAFAALHGSDSGDREQTQNE